MARTSVSPLAAAAPLFAFALGLAASGCFVEQSTLLIERVVPPTESDGACVIDPSTNVSIARGTFDVVYPGEYQLGLVLVNNFANESPENNNQIDNSIVRLKYFQVDLATPQDPTIAQAVAAAEPTLVSFRVNVGSSAFNASDEQGIPVTLFTRSASEQFAAVLRSRNLADGTKVEVLASIQVVAEQNQKEIESSVFRFPVDVCIECLLDCSVCPGGLCPPADDVGGIIGGTCGFLQDAPAVPAACGGQTTTGGTTGAPDTDTDALP